MAAAGLRLPRPGWRGECGPRSRPQGKRRGREGSGRRRPAPLHPERTFRREEQVEGEPGPPLSRGGAEGNRSCAAGRRNAPGRGGRPGSRVARGGNGLPESWLRRGGDAPLPPRCGRRPPNFLRGERRPGSWADALPRLQGVS